MFPPLLFWITISTTNLGSLTSAPNELVFHTLLETLYFALALASAWLAWSFRETSFQLRTALTACFLLVVSVFSLLHLITMPGMPGMDATYGVEASFYFSRIARFALPLALLSMAIVPGTLSLSAPGRLLLFGTSLAIMAPFIAYGFGLDFSAEMQSERSWLIPLVRSSNIVTFLLAAVAALRINTTSREYAHYLILASLLGAMAESFMLHSQGVGISTASSVIGHAYGINALIAVLIALHGATVRKPFSELKNTYTDTQLLAQLHQQALNSISDGLLCLDQQMRVQLANTSARRLAGISTTAESDIPLHNFLCLGAENIESINATIKTCLQEGKSFSATTASWSTKGDSEPRTIEYWVKPLRDIAGEITGAALIMSDISPQQRLQKNLQAAAEYVRDLFEASPDTLIAVGPDGVVTDANQAAEITCSSERHQLIGTHFVSLFTDTAQARAMMLRALSGDTLREQPLVLARKDGGVIHVTCSIAPHRGPGGIRGAFAVVRDTTDLHQTQLQLQFQADCDALTALPNRRQFQAHLARAIARSKRDNQPVAVMVVDLDDFKDVNDTLGTASGDELLKIVSRRLSETLRETDFLARLGGDEFGILATSTALVSEVQPLIERILSAISKPLSLAERELSIACSIGVAIHPHDANDADSLLTNADTAMYRAKENGKNACQYFEQEMNDALRRRVALAHQLRGALARNEFTLHYQPQIILEDNRIYGVEALLRWNNAELGFVSPAEFIPVAEDTGLILPIGAWVVNEACQQSARWRHEHGIELQLAVNLSARQFRDPGLLAMIRKALEDTGLPPERLELELTESMLMRDTSGAAATMEKLKALGAELAIDDFGTGYSSLAYLKRFPIDKLKIDRSFVMDIPGDANDTAIVHAILAMAQGLNLEVVAEGAETADQMEFLRTHGCDVVQGYFVSRPLPATDLPDFIERWQSTLNTREEPAEGQA